MIKVYENQFPKSFSRQFSQTEKDKKDNPKLLLNHYMNKNASSFFQNPALRDECNIFKSNSNYLKRTNISDYNFKNNNPIMNCNTNRQFQRRISLKPETNISIKNNIFASNANLKKSFRKKEKKRTGNDGQFLPKIENDNATKRMKKDNSSIIKNNKMEQQKDKHRYLRLRTKSVVIPKVKNFEKSSKNVKKVAQKELILSPYASKRKFKKMNTVLNLHSDLNKLLEGKKNRKYEENGDNRSNIAYDNQELLYSQKFNNFILKIYKTSDSQSQNQQKPEEKIIKKQKKKKKKKSEKFTIKDYLNSFEPKKYIKKLKDKQLNIYAEDLNEIKNKTLEKSNAYIEYFVFKKNKSQKKKKDIFEKIKEKNGQLINKYKKDFLQTLINAILLKENIKHKKIIYKIFIDILSIANDITFHIYIKLNIMRHVLTKSEKDENLYFFNLIKHFLYSGTNKKCMVKYPFIKCYGDFINPMLKKIKTFNQFIESNNKKMHYIFFSIKFQQYDSETILNKYDENVKIVPKNEAKAKSKSIGENNNNESFRDDSDNFSTIENRIIMRRRTRRSTIFSKYKNLSTPKLMNINLTKSIIKLRGTNFEDIFKNKNNSNLKLINAKVKQNNNSNVMEDISESSDSYEYNNYIKSYRNNYNQNINNRITEGKEQNNEEIHLRDKKLLFEHFISCVEFSEYDKLYHWLKKSGKYMDLNYKFDNGDTLLHLCVRHSVPHYLIKFLIINGININGQNNHGDTALHIAAKNHKYKMIDLLIKLGASEYIYNNQKKFCWECL